MKVQVNKTNKGFTLIEMIGVLAVIAILAALLIPKVFQAITEAKINTVPVGCATVKTAVVDHYAKYGSLWNLKGDPTALTAGANFDEAVLMVEGFLDKPFAPRVGTLPDIVCADMSAAGANVDPTDGISWDLAGDGAVTAAAAATATDTTGSYVVYAEIKDVPMADAQAISMRIDGAEMSTAEADKADGDWEGRVKYAAGTTDTDVYIYLTHR